MERIVTYTLIVLVVVSGCRSKKHEIAYPKTSHITEAVFATGHVEPAHQFVLMALNEGYLKQILVAENEVVRKGQVLFVQDASVQQIQESAAIRNVSIARKNLSANSPVLAQLRAQLSSAVEKRMADSLQYDRMKRLHQSKSVARVDFENAALSYESSKNTVNTIEENILSTKLNLEQVYINAESQLQTAVITKSYYSLTSSGTYRVYEITKKNGELVRKGEQIALLGHPDSLLVKLNIDEASVAKIKTGQKVLVELNTQKGATHIAKISKIYPYFNEPEQAYTAEATFDPLPQGVIAGTLLQANIIIASKANALLIPRECLSLDGRVLVMRGNAIDTVLIKTGIISTDWVEVLSGINTSDKLIKAY